MASWYEKRTEPDWNFKDWLVLLVLIGLVVIVLATGFHI